MADVSPSRKKTTKRRISADFKSKIQSKKKRSKSVDRGTSSELQPRVEEKKDSPRSEVAFKSPRKIPLRASENFVREAISKASPRQRKQRASTGSSLTHISKNQKVVPPLGLGNLSPFNEEIPEHPCIDILCDKLPWFKSKWDLETDDTRQEILEAFKNISTGKSNYAESYLLRPKVSFRQREQAGGCPSLEIFGSVKDKAQIALTAIELSKKTTELVQGIMGGIPLSGNSKNDSPSPISAEQQSALFESVLDSVFIALSPTHKHFGDRKYYRLIFTALAAHRESYSKTFQVNGSAFEQETSTKQKIILCDIKTEVSFSFIKVRNILEELCILLLKEQKLSLPEQILLIGISKSFVDNLVQLTTQLAKLKSYLTTLQKSTPPQQQPRLFSYSAFEKSEIKKIFDSKRNSHWPNGAFTINALIHDAIIANDNNTLLRAFIGTHEAFISSKDLLRKLVGCYFEAASHLDEKDNIRKRICTAFQLWVESYTIHSFDDPIMRVFSNFVKNRVSSDYPQLSTYILKSIDLKLETAKNVSQASISPNVQMIDIDNLRSNCLVRFFETYTSVEIAQQLTVIDTELLCHVKTFNLLNCAWDREKLAHRSVPVVRCLQRLDAVSHWAATMILLSDTTTGRANTIKSFIGVCEELRKLKNYLSLASIVVAMDIVSISRLKLSFATLGKKYLKQLQELKDLFDPTSSFKNYRQQIASSSLPLIPYLGVTLSDLTFIDEGNPDAYDNGLINFDKHTLVFDAIREISHYQESRYSFEKQEPLYSSLLGIPAFDSESLYYLSRSQEPRQ